jgi:hypothetical protein
MADKMCLNNFKTFGGKHCQTTSLRHVLSYKGLKVSEEMLFGLGGGIGFIYWYMNRMPAPFVGSRGGKGDDFLVDSCSRLGIEANFTRTSSEKRGYGRLKQMLADDMAGCIMVDMAYLPYLALPEDAHFGGHTVAVFGIDEKKNEVSLADRGRFPFTITIENLKMAKNSCFPPFAPRNALLELDVPKKLSVEPMNIEDAIRDCSHNMLHPPIKNLGLEGLLKWSKLVVKWPAQFHGLNLFACLFNVFIYIEIGGTGGAAFRPMFADFLDEAAKITGRNEYSEPAGLYLEAARVWRDIAFLALPDDWPVLCKMRELMLEKNRVFEQEDFSSFPRLLELNREMEPLMHLAAKELDENSGGQRDDLLKGLQRKILELYEIEKQAAQKMESLVTPGEK